MTRLSSEFLRRHRPPTDRSIAERTQYRNIIKEVHHVLTLRRLRTSWILILALALAAISSSVSAEAAPVPTPESFLGFRPGADRKLASWDQIKEYFAMVDEASDRVVVNDIGPTELGERMIMAIVSSEDTIADLDAAMAIQKRLADPRGLSAEEREDLTARAKTVVMVAASIHSTEIGGTQAAINTLFELASSKDPRTVEILENTILLLVPSLNPDGHVMVVDWYNKYLGTPLEGGSLPWLYHTYAGHDDNRDWFMFNLDESINIGKVLYHDWFPQIVYDIHQMGSSGARLFVPPFFDPPNPEIDPLIFREILLLGGAATTELSAAGLTGVSTNAQYDTWWHGGMRSGPYYHNMVGLLTEAASVNIASPVEIPFEKLTGSTRGLPNAKNMLTNFPELWPGGTWTLGDIVEYEEVTIRGFLTAAARYRELFIDNFVFMAQRAVEKGETQSPYAFVLPATENNADTLALMVNTLRFQGMEIHQAAAPFTAGGVTYPEGSFVVLTAQPYRANVMALLDRQTYPERREYPGGPAERPYDIAGWTLPMQMGLECVKVADKFEADLYLLTYETVAAGRLYAGNATYGYAIRPEANNAAVIRNRLLDQGVELAWTSAPIPAEAVGVIGVSGSLPAGTTIIRQAPGVATKLALYAAELGVDVYPLATEPEVATVKLDKPRLALYENWGGNADAGWTRMIFDDFEFEYTHLRDARVRAGNLASEFDVIILPDSSLSSVKNGMRAGSAPEEYTGGMGDAGFAALKEFVEAGGTLITFDSLGDFAIDILGVPVKNALKGIPSSKFYGPGSILEVDVDNSHPVAYGLPDKIGAYFNSSPAFEVSGNAITIGAYPADHDPMMSGWLMGPEFIQGKTAIAEVPYGLGNVIMIGFRPQHRGQPHGTYKLIFNSIFYAASGN